MVLDIQNANPSSFLNLGSALDQTCWSLFSALVGVVPPGLLWTRDRKFNLQIKHVLLLWRSTAEDGLCRMPWMRLSRALFAAASVQVSQLWLSVVFPAHLEWVWG